MIKDRFALKESRPFFKISAKLVVKMFLKNEIYILKVTLHPLFKNRAGVR
jgi:hypothetical protein